MTTVGVKGIEICCKRSGSGKVVFARLCRVVQQLLQERYPEMYSVDLMLHKHELTQLSICPVCLESGVSNPTCFLVEACVHTLLEMTAQNCRYHPESIPLDDLIPDYLMVNFPLELYFDISSLDYESRPLHQGKCTCLYEGNITGILFKGNSIVIDPNEIAFSCKLLNTIIVRIAHHNIASTVHSHSSRMVELPYSRTLRAK